MGNVKDTLKVMLFDDNVNVRDSITMLLAATPNLELVAAMPSCVNLIEQLKEFNPDVVLMDIDMPGITGIEAVRLIRREDTKLPVLMLTGFEDDEKVFASICAGANGYILKNAGMDMLIHYINEVYLGGAPMTPVIARKVLNRFAMEQSSREGEDFNLSSREKEVLQLLVKGKSYKMIAAELHISYETVHSHIRKIYQKLQVNSVGEAVSKTISNRILRIILLFPFI